MQIALNLLVHALFLGIGFLSISWLDQFPVRYAPVLEILPYGLAATSILLGLRFNRSRIIFSTLVLIGAYALVDIWAPNLDKTQQKLLVNTIVPFIALNTALIGFYSERGIFTPPGITRLLLILFQLAGILWTVHTLHPAVTTNIYRSLISGLEITHPLLGEPALLATLTGALGAIAAYLSRPGPFRSALIGAMILGIYAATRAPDPILPIAVLYSFALVFPLLILVHESYRMAFVDELTGLKGRRALNESLGRLGSHYVIAMLDVDHFKKFNDRYGHDAGDDVLRLLGSKLKAVGGGGKPFRYGGEEFTVLFSGLDAAGAKPHLEALREAVATKKFTMRKQERRKVQRAKKRSKTATPRSVKVTISIGVAERNDRFKTPGAVLKAADKALYRAKRKGRNRVSR